MNFIVRLSSRVILFCFPQNCSLIPALNLYNFPKPNDFGYMDFNMGSRAAMDPQEGLKLFNEGFFNGGFCF